MGYANWLSPKLEPRGNPDKAGHGIYAVEAVAAGEVLAVWGGRVASEDVLAAMSEPERWYTLQVEEGLFLVPAGPVVDDAELINHSCAPNAGLSGQITLVALRDIGVGEEVCYDYATTDASPLTMNFACACGERGCRGRITADDWRRPDLQRRYRGHFSPYLQRRIDALAAPLLLCEPAE
ncbi:MAG TPA: SET domain-containing protein-lysine N-methyltransferase [Geminicoccaceae bacterium]|nr:SET domain-containing protein-lysine N-methyltransferase [Geminicoccaceae bacterium]